MIRKCWFVVLIEPEVPERLWPTVNHLTDEQINKVTHGNAMRFFNFDLFKHHTREQMSVAGLRAMAKAKGGAAPLAAGETRVVTSGDIVGMFTRHAEPA
jgi:hypothetical protein